MEVTIATPEEMQELSRLSMRVGNIPFFAGQSTAAIMRDGKEIVGFAAVQNAQHAAGSWVKEELRRRKHSYELRSCLENELRRRGIPVYFALPGNDFEKQLFAKYGNVTEQQIQIRHL